MDILVGHTDDTHTQGTGWFIGFSPWTRRQGSDLLHVPAAQPVTGLCVKWFNHAAGHDSGPGKPISEGRTVSILVSPDSEFRIEFCANPGFDGSDRRCVLLSRPGDFAAWGAGVFHRWHSVRASTVLTIRWTP